MKTAIASLILFCSFACNRDLEKKPTVLPPPVQQQIGDPDMMPSATAACGDSGQVCCVGKGTYCHDDLVCLADGTCGPDLSCGGVGESCCNVFGNVNVCVPGATCDSSDTCIASPDMGDSCGGCPAGEVCNAGVCATPCSTDQDCPQPGVCSNGFCAKPAGAADGGTGLPQCTESTGGVKIEGGQIGQSQTIAVGGVTVVIAAADWTKKTDSYDYCGFQFLENGGTVYYTVKSGLEFDTAATTSWLNPNGTSGPAVSGISNIIFCVLKK